MTAILIAHLLDLLTFLPAVTIWGIGGEGNPIARLAYDLGGIPGVAVLKVAGVLFVVAVLSGVPDSMGKGIAVSVIVTLGILGALSNLYAIKVAL